MSEVLSVVPRTIWRDLADLQKKGVLIREGNTSAGHWVIIEQSLETQPTADKQQDTIQQPLAGEIQSPVATQLQLTPSRLDFSQDVFEILNQTGRGEIERVTFR